MLRGTNSIARLLAFSAGILTSSCALAQDSTASCDSIDQGYSCSPNISRSWGQYSPFYAVASSISPEIPTQCNVSFVQVVARHGARYPTAKKSKKYRKTIAKIQKKADSFDGKYSFLKKYQYDLGADQLTQFGVQEMLNLGTSFYERYGSLAAQNSLGPFVRANSAQRVMDSASNFSLGFHNAAQSAHGTDTAYPYPVLSISESQGFNNSLEPNTCSAFQSSKTAKDARDGYADIFLPPISQRLSKDLGMKISDKKTLRLLDMCPFETVADPTGTPSPFCSLFTPDEWAQFEYRATLYKYYGYGEGNPLGPTEGVGFVNELISRMTNSPVADHTSVNQTLDGSNATFPLNRNLYADFTHEGGLTGIMWALGLFNGTPALSKTKLMTPEQLNGYSASRTSPFAARMYVEKLQCADETEETVRVLVNGEVMPLDQCEGVDAHGRCKLSKFIESLAFAQSGGNWAECDASVATAR